MSIVWEEREFKKQDSTTTRKERNIYRRHHRKQFLEELYDSGEIAALGKAGKGARSGKISQMYNIHHKTPLSLGGKSNSENLCVIDVEIHDAMNETVIDPQTLHSGKREGTFFVPVLKNVTTKANSPELWERLKEAKQRMR